jgi:hypothetical protein
MIACSVGGRAGGWVVVGVGEDVDVGGLVGVCGWGWEGGCGGECGRGCASWLSTYFSSCACPFRGQAVEKRLSSHMHKIFIDRLSTRSFFDPPTVDETSSLSIK